MVKDKSKTLSSHSIPSSQAQLHSFTPSSSSSFHLRHVGNGSAGLCMMVHLCCNFLCTLFPCCNVGFLPRDKVFNELLQHDSSPQCTVLKIVPVWVPHGLQLLPENLLLYVLSMGHSSCQEPALVWVPYRLLQLLSGYLDFAVWGPPWTAGWITAPL